MRVSKEMKATDYEKGIEFWEKQPATYEGVLDGHIQCHPEDISSSQRTLLKWLKLMPRQVRALDCGAGVGRVTKELLIKHFDFIDLIEPAKNFIE